MDEIVEEKKTKMKRELFRFNGEKPTVINLEHVTYMTLEGNKINFSFHSNGLFIELESPDIAKTVFEQLINLWACDVLV